MVGDGVPRSTDGAGTWLWGRREKHSRRGRYPVLVTALCMVVVLAVIGLRRLEKFANDSARHLENAWGLSVGDGVSVEETASSETSFQGEESAVCTLQVPDGEVVATFGDGDFSEDRVRSNREEIEFVASDADPSGRLHLAEGLERCQRQRVRGDDRLVVCRTVAGEYRVFEDIW